MSHLPILRMKAVAMASNVESGIGSLEIGPITSTESPLVGRNNSKGARFQEKYSLPVDCISSKEKATNAGKVQQHSAVGEIKSRSSAEESLASETSSEVL